MKVNIFYSIKMIEVKDIKYEVVNKQKIIYSFVCDNENIKIISNTINIDVENQETLDYKIEDNKIHLLKPIKKLPKSIFITL